MRYTFVGSRRAIALTVLGILFTTFGWLGLLLPEEFQAMFLGLSGCYFLAFLGVAGGYFWGRWYATGIGWSGAMSILAISQADDPWPVVIWSGLHGLVIGVLAGRRMAEEFELKPEWRKRWNLDDAAVKKIGGAVTSVASSLPLIVAKLLYRPELAAVGAAVATVAALALLLRARTAGVLAATTAAGLVLVAGPLALPNLTHIDSAFPHDLVSVSSLANGFVAAALLVPLALFGRSIVRYLARG